MQNVKYKLKFAKTGDMKYISHLDLVRLFSRATRRAELPVVLSEGFSPRPKISIFPAIKLGLESNDLEAVFVLDRDVEVQGFKNSLQSQLPEGIKILEVRKNE